jgi:exonuclease SbcC
MRIERIELQNWMSYPGRWTLPDGLQAGEVTVPAIDLSGQSLTLIAGQNGAGKSAILEAVCYALFAKYPRGNNQDAIRSGERSAELRLYFTLPSASGDVTYCVDRLLSKKTSGTNASLKQVQADGSEVLLLTGQSRVTDYIEQTLLRGIKYDAFVSTVFLRQEEAGKFMKLSHAQQREQLLRLCRLEIYQQIYERAQTHRKALDSQLRTLRDDFDEVKYATSEYLSGRQEYAQTLQRRRDELRQDEESAKQLLEKVTRATTLEGEIKERTEKLAEWKDILGQADEIHHAVQWRIAWERVEDTLQQGQGLHSNISRRVDEIQQAELDLQAAEADARQAEVNLSSLETGHRTLHQELSEIRDALPTLVQERAEKTRELENARQAKRLDKEIEQIAGAQAEREVELARFDQVERQSTYCDLLGQAQNALQYIVAGLQEAEKDQTTAENKGDEALKAKQKVADIKASVEEERAVLQQLSEKKEELEQEQSELQRQISSAQDIVENRNRAIEAGTCPTCGTEIKGDISEHVCDEIERRMRQIATSQTRLEDIKHKLAAVQAEMAQLDTEIATQDQQIAVLENQAELAESMAANARERATSNRQQAEERWQEHLILWEGFPRPGWLNTPSRELQERVEEESGGLRDIDAEHQRLIGIKAQHETEAETLQKNKQRRTEIAITSPVTEEQLLVLTEAQQETDERVTAKEEKRDKLAEKVAELENRLSEVKRALEEARGRRDKANSTLSSLSASQESDRHHLEDIEKTLRSQKQRTESQFPDLAANLLIAVQEAETYERLEELATEYAEEAELLEELEQANAHSTRVQTEIQVKQDELGSLHKEVGSATEAEVSQKLEIVQNDIASVEQELAEVNQEIGRTRDHHKRQEDLATQLKETKDEHWAYRTIEDAIYPGTKTKPAGELFASITHKLMESIGLEASRILESLGWYMAIGYDEQTGFSIEDRALGAVRSYSAYSGGERFAIAIAVALAVGRVTHGAGHIHCLFIDEGFGALDQSHRKRIINDAIGRLIEVGACEQVVVITHLRDMQAYFPNRIELKREDNHSVLAALTEELME